MAKALGHPVRIKSFVCWLKVSAADAIWHLS